MCIPIYLDFVPNDETAASNALLKGLCFLVYAPLGPE
jgi:hypothetical protein